jgi:hypothetical protein
VTHAIGDKGMDENAGQLAIWLSRQVDGSGARPMTLPAHERRENHMYRPRRMWPSGPVLAIAAAAAIFVTPAAEARAETGQPAQARDVAASATAPAQGSAVANEADAVPWPTYDSCQVGWFCAYEHFHGNGGQPGWMYAISGGPGFADLTGEIERDNISSIYNRSGYTVRLYDYNPVGGCWWLLWTSPPGNWGNIAHIDNRTDYIGFGMGLRNGWTQC